MIPRTRVLITRPAFLSTITKLVDISDKTVIVFASNSDDDDSELIQANHMKVVITYNSCDETHVRVDNSLKRTDSDSSRESIDTKKDLIAKKDLIVRESEVKVSIEVTSTESVQGTLLYTLLDCGSIEFLYSFLQKKNLFEI